MPGTNHFTYLMEKQPMRKSLLCLVLAAAGLSNAVAQDGYPTKPLRWIVPFEVGGGTDAVARPIAMALGEVLRQTVIYENRGGGGGLLAAELVARAAPDGYTFLVAAGNTPEAFASFIEFEMERWGRVVKVSGAKME